MELSKDVVHVVGSGIIGLGAAIYFRQQGFPVHVVSANDTYLPTSPVAGAFWLPYACSMSIEEEIALAQPTYSYLQQCASDPISGVQPRCGFEYFDSTVDKQHYERTPWWASLDGISFERRSENEIASLHRSNTILGPIVAGWEFRVPVVNTPLLLQWLENQARSFGVTFENRNVESLDQQLSQCSILINCTGGWATRLTHEEKMVGTQGVAVAVAGEPFGSDLIFLEQGRSSSLPTYIIPQTVRTVLGGSLEPLTQPGEVWNVADRSKWQPAGSMVENILDRCRSLVTPSGDIDVIRASAALRPVRFQSPPRIEKEIRNGKVVLHNYGHGGSGVTTFWGSAMLAHELL